MPIYREKLQQGIVELGLVAETGYLDSLLAFIELIARWNKVYNLTAVRNPEDMLSLHILDSLAVLPYIKPSTIADIGAGAGLPGIPLAIFRPDCRFVLLDANAKKTRFIKQAVLELQLKNVEVVHSRVETFKPGQLFSTVITRAFADIEAIIKLTRHLQAADGLLLAMKGRRPDQELAKVQAAYTVEPIKV
ncbi:MAG: 16S rRNA (guanine(527)-N(7))-methyltransferase RsmG, partial [Methylomonas sp.]